MKHLRFKVNLEFKYLCRSSMSVCHSQCKFTSRSVDKILDNLLEWFQRNPLLEISGLDLREVIESKTIISLEPELTEITKDLSRLCKD